MTPTETKSMTTGLPSLGFDEALASHVEGGLDGLEEIFRRVDESNAAIKPEKQAKVFTLNTKELEHSRRFKFCDECGDEVVDTRYDVVRNAIMASNEGARILFFADLVVNSARTIMFEQTTSSIVLSKRFDQCNSPHWHEIPICLWGDNEVNPEPTPQARKDWQKIFDGLGLLQDGWDSYRAPAPSSDSITRAMAFLEQVTKTEKHDLSRLAPSVVGGVGFTFKHGGRKVYVEFRNTGSIHALFSDGVSDPDVSPIQPNRDDYFALITRIKKYLHE